MSRVHELRVNSLASVIALFPVAVFFLGVLFLALPITRQGAIWLLEENHPVEMLTFVFLVAGGFRGLALAFRGHRHNEERLCVWFYLIFSLGLLLTAMEEVAWGQKLVDFQTPSGWRELNAQGEMTLHNVHVLQGRSELFRLTFGLGGLIGIWAARYPPLRKIAAPAILLSWFLVITAHSVVDVCNDIVPVQKDFDAAMYRLSELIEMLIGIAGFLYMHLNSLMLNARGKAVCTNRHRFTARRGSP